MRGAATIAIWTQSGGLTTRSSAWECSNTSAKRLPEYFQHAWNLLRAGGVFLNHGIASLRPCCRRDRRSSTSTSFPTEDWFRSALHLRFAEGVGFEVRDVESLREHYAHTTALGAAAGRTATRPQDDQEVTYRIWRIYLAGSAAPSPPAAAEPLPGAPQQAGSGRDRICR